ncbi:MAG: chemotaxis-specific protein-glutamate methyltransferase CheB [Phycisphaerae bacterium]|nr:chemotaxis-specific protein-glutamate methyltransferase CheB [Phycisphaerae bacterium]
MRIAIVNDLAMAREALRRAVAAVPDAVVAWTAVDGAEAVAKAQADRPDLILMDLIMPGTDGVEATRQIMQRCPCAIVVVTATVEGNASRVYEAIGAGALDAVDTPRIGSNGSSDALAKKIELIRRQRAGEPVALGAGAVACQPCAADLVNDRSGCAPEPCADLDGPCAPLVAIGSSTGGPQALATVLSALPAAPTFATLIVQHMDPAFLPGLTSWLAERTDRSVRLARSGDRPAPGDVLLAGEPRQMVVIHRGTVCYTAGPPDLVHRPSVDVLFESLASSSVDPGVAVLLTGMGRDGARGLLSLRTKRWATIAQDRATSVVWGMPGAASELNAAERVLPISEIGPAIAAAMSTRHAARTGGAR